MAKILLVEDDPMIAEIYQRKFESAGFSVINAKTGKEVLKYALQEKFDLVLLDMVLPEMSGMEVLKELRKSGEYPRDLRVVIFSNLNQAEVQDEALKLGADGFIGKTEYAPSELVVQIQKMLQQFSEQEKNAKRREGEQKAERKGSVLFIEDEELFLEMFGKKLEDEGFEVVYAKNGAWGLEEARKRHFDVVVTDIVLPNMDGEEIVRNLKGDDATKDIPIIVLSASVADDAGERVREMGAADFFIKTHIIPSDLVRKIEELIG